MKEFDMDKTCEQLLDVLNQAGGHHGEQVVALFGVIGTVVADVQCPGCRQATSKMIRKQIPKLLKSALAYAAERDGGGSTHIH